MKDILQQMMVKTESGERLLFPDLREQALKDGRREEYEVRRLDILMKLGVSVREEGPLRVKDVAVVRNDGDES